MTLHGKVLPPGMVILSLFFFMKTLYTEMNLDIRKFISIYRNFKKDTVLENGHFTGICGAFLVEN